MKYLIEETDSFSLAAARLLLPYQPLVNESTNNKGIMIKMIKLIYTAPMKGPPCKTEYFLKEVMVVPTGDILPDVLVPNLKLVICGSAVGVESARAGSYYAGKNNMFWQILHEIGLTDRLLRTSEYSELLNYGIGLTDAAKKISGVDSNIKKEDYDTATFVQKMFFYQPRIVCFNGKKAAAALCSWQRQRNCRTKEIDYGIYPHSIMQNGPTIFVAPSTSAAAKRYWKPDYWHNLAALFQQLP